MPNTTQNCSKWRNSRSVICLALLWVLVSTAAGAAPDELSDARKTLGERFSGSSARVAAARVLMDSGRRSQQEKVFEVLFDETESAAFILALLPTVRPAMLDEAGGLAEGHAKRVRKMAASSRPDWKVHGLRLGAALELDGLDDKALELLADATAAIARNQKRDPRDRESVREEITQVRVSCALLAQSTPPSPDLLWTLKTLRTSPDREVRKVAVETYILLGVDVYAETLAETLDDSSTFIYQIASEALIEARRPEVVPALIDLLEPAASSIDARVLPALFRATGQRYLTRKQWEKWLARTEPVIVLDEDEFEAAQEALADAVANSRYGPQGSFFTRTIADHGVVFLLDVSSSMNGIVRSTPRSSKGLDVFLPTDTPKRTRMELVKSQVQNALDGLTEQPFNIITFGTDVETWKEGGSRSFATREEALASAAAYLSGLRPVGATNLHDGLEAAFREGDIGEIFLLSDGDPSTGITDPKRIRRAVKRWAQRSKHVALHCISMGLSNSLLEEIAPLTQGGSYVEVEVARGR